MVGRNTDAVSPRRRDRTKRPTACAKNSGVEIVVAYTPTASRGTSTPSDTMRTATIQRLVVRAELVDPLRGAGVVGEHDGRLAAGDLAQQLGVGARRVLVGGDDEAARVRDALADLRQPLVGGAQHVRHPVAARVQRRAPGLRDGVLGHRLAEPGGDLVAGLGAPAHVAAVGEEDDRPDDAVGRARCRSRRCSRRTDRRIPSFPSSYVTKGMGLVSDRNGRSGQGQAPGRRVEGLQAGLAPGLRVAGVVDLVEDDQGLALLAAVAVQHRAHADTGVGDGDPVVVLAERPCRRSTRGRAGCLSGPPPPPTAS